MALQELQRLDRPSSGRKTGLRLSIQCTKAAKNGFKTSTAESVESQIHEKHMHNVHYLVSAYHSTGIKMFLHKNK